MPDVTGFGIDDDDRPKTAQDVDLVSPVPSQWTIGSLASIVSSQFYET